MMTIIKKKLILLLLTTIIMININIDNNNDNGFVNGFTFGPILSNLLTIGQLTNRSLFVVTKSKQTYIVNVDELDMWTQTWRIPYRDTVDLYTRYPWIKQLSLYKQFFDKDYNRYMKIITPSPKKNLLGFYGDHSALFIDINKKKATLLDMKKIEDYNTNLLPVSTLNQGIGFVRQDKETITLMAYQFDEQLSPFKPLTYRRCSDYSLVIDGNCSMDAKTIPFPYITNAFSDLSSDLHLFTDDDMIIKFPISGHRWKYLPQTTFLNVDVSVNPQLSKFLSLISWIHFKFCSFYLIFTNRQHY